MSATATAPVADRIASIKAEQERLLDAAEAETSPAERARLLAEFDRLQAEREALQAGRPTTPATGTRATATGAQADPAPINTAYHEAAHVVALWAVGDTGCHASVIPTAKGLGTVTPSRVLGDVETAVMALAGVVGGDLSPQQRPTGSGWAGATDDALASNALAQYPSLIPEARRKAEAIVRGNFLAVKALAGQLLARGSMTAQQIAETLRPYLPLSS